MYVDIYKHHKKVNLEKALKTKELLIVIKENIRDTILDLQQYSDRAVAYGININIDFNNIAFSTTSKKHLLSMDINTRDDMVFKYLGLKLYSLILRYKKEVNNYKFIIEAKNIPYHIFKYIIQKNNEINVQGVLKGRRWHIGKSCGYIQIMRTKRKYITADGTETKTIDWGQSYAILKDIARRQEEEGLHNLYSKLTQKEIEFTVFSTLMKKYTYNKENTHLPKYLVYKVNDVYNWWYWKNRNLFIKNMKMYRFEPTSYINTDTRLIEDVLNKVNNIEDVIHNNLLGNLEKTSVLCSFDPNYSLKFDKNE